MQMDLERTHALPLQRGWMNCFRRWTAARKFHEFWLQLRPQYSWGFIRFCEEVLNVPKPPVHAVRWTVILESTRLVIRYELNREFASDWSGVPLSRGTWGTSWAEHYLRDVVNDAAAFTPFEGPLLWTLTHGATSNGSRWSDGGGGGGASFPLGVAAVRTTVGGAFKPVGQSDTFKQDMYYELFFWVRPAYRTAEIGRDVLRGLLKRIDAELPANGGPRYLLVRFPKSAGGTDNIVRALWATFFNDHDFHNYRLEQDVADDELRLRRLVH